MVEPLDPEARALWRRVTETVRPLHGRRLPKPRSPLPRGEGAGAGEREAQASVAPLVSATVAPVRAVKPEGTRKSPPPPANTLDASWDKRLRLGAVAPDAVIDLHGYTVADAHAELEAGLARAIARQARLVLLVTGRPPPPGRSRLDNPLRGVIRASIGDWLHHSAQAGRIAAVRNAHPRHGGAGALYVILRRARG